MFDKTDQEVDRKLLFCISKNLALFCFLEFLEG